MKNLGLTHIIKFSLISLFLGSGLGCVVTPNGEIISGVDVGVGVDVLPPQIITSDNSFVSVRVGPGFYASDAYLLAYDYCLNRGMYAYEFSPWAHSSGVIRDLRYDCRPNYIAPPVVFNVDRRNRFRYNYFQDYYRSHRPGYHYTRPSSGWWGRNNRNNFDSPPPRQPIVTTPQPRYSRDGRLTTQDSPWSYNPNKNDNRYQPRNTPVANPPPSKPGWWGRSGSNSRPSYSSPSNSQPSTPAPSVSPQPSRNGGGFWGGSKSSTSSQSTTPRYSAPRSYDKNPGKEDSVKEREYSSSPKSSSPPVNRFAPKGSPSNPTSGRYSPKWINK